MGSVLKKKMASKVNFLMILTFSFICGHLVNEGFRIYDLLTTKTESCLDISIEDSCSTEAKMFGIEEAEDCISYTLFNPYVAEYSLCVEPIPFASNIHEVYLGLNTPPPEQKHLLA